MLTPSIQKNDKKAKVLIGIFSAVVFLVVVFLNKFTLNVELPFDKHIFALANAILNSAVCVLLVAALFAVKSKKFGLHKNLMLFAMLLSVLFLVSYIAHHLFAGETIYGDSDFNGKVDSMEAIAVGNMKPFYLVLLFTHIILAATSLPFILFTAYRGLTGEYEDHKRKAKRMWPIWFYVAATGPLVYLMIKPYYH
jgi:putative membrane protein